MDSSEARQKFGRKAADIQALLEEKASTHWLAGSTWAIGG